MSHDKENKIKDISDDEVRIIGTTTASGNDGNDKRRKWYIIGALCAALVIVLLVLILTHHDNTTDTANSMPLTTDGTATEDSSVNDVWYANSDSSGRAHVTRRDTVVAGMHLSLMTPYNATPELSVGELNSNDKSIILALQAADIRRDNGGIVGAFVLKGEPLAWSLSKKGFCAIINDRMIIGVADNSPYFEQTAEQGGYFFRQFPLVDRGQACESEQTKKAARRALCSINDEVVIVLCHDKVLMTDFAKALAQLGAYNAIYLVGGDAHGIYLDDTDGQTHKIGEKWSKKMKNVNYLIFRS